MIALVHMYMKPRRKAWTSIRLKRNSRVARHMNKSSYGIRFLSEAPLGGGLPVNGGFLLQRLAFLVLPEMDEECAQIGIDAIEEEIEQIVKFGGHNLAPKR